MNAEPRESGTVLACIIKIRRGKVSEGIEMKITGPVQHYLRSAWYYQKKADFLNEKIMVLQIGRAHV